MQILLGNRILLTYKIPLNISTCGLIIELFIFSLRNFELSGNQQTIGF